MHNVKTRVLAAGMMFLMMLISWPSFGKDNALERVKKQGKLLIALEPTYPPMESEDDSGKLEGFDIDFAKELAKRLGVSANFISMSWEGILAGLHSNRYDVVISAMNITPERQKQVDFVEYARMSQIFIAAKGIDVKTEKDLAGKVVALQAGSTSHEYSEGRQKAGIAIKEIKAFKFATDAFSAVKAGQAQVVIADEPVGKFFVKKDKHFIVTGRAMEPEPIGIAIRKGDKELHEAIAKAVEEMRKDGTLKKISETWFGGVLGG